jgi:cyclophilin family peptidyl-prolyl cis-trans isomerase
MSAVHPRVLFVEPLEARIAPALVIGNPLPDIVAGPGKTGASVDLSKLTAPASADAYHTRVQFITNYDTDPNTAGIQAGVIEIDLFDDAAPLTVQNFLAYVNNANKSGDYDGTLFHRAIAGFVLQGGGFNAATPTTHIPVFPSLHNEPDIVHRSNVAGTVAMAKLDGDPNSATSEWFINLVDNSGGGPALNTQNGGFTVFGKVTDASLTLATAISNLSKGNVGFGSTVPIQDGRLISVVDAVVLPHVSTPTPGLTYTVESVFAAGTTTPSNLLTGKITGSTLALKYAPGKSGLVEVTVKVSDGTVTKTDTFRVDVRPNLITKIAGDPLPFLIVPGDSSSVKFQIINNGGAVAQGLADVTVKLARLRIDTVPDPNKPNEVKQILVLPDPPSTQILTTLSNVSLNIASGGVLGLSAKVNIPATLAGTGDFYRLLVEVTPKTGTAAQERFPNAALSSGGDNVALNGPSHDLVAQFGNISATTNFDGGTQNYFRPGAVLKYATTDAANQATTVAWTLKGPGVGAISADGSGLTVSGTALASSVTATLKAGSGHLSLKSIDLTDYAGSVSLANVDVHGPVTASAGVKTLILGDLTLNGAGLPAGQALLLIGAPLPDTTVKGAITLRNVNDFSLQSAMPLASLTVAKWTDTTGTANDTITAPSIGLLKATGNFEADVDLSDDSATPTSVAIGGFLRNATLHTAANFGTITLGAIEKSSVFAGVAARPASLAAFTEPHTIQSFTIAGIKGATTPLFVDSQVAAQTIGTIKVQGVSTATGGSDSGFVADVIRSYSRTPGVTKSNVAAPGVFDDLGNYQVRVL